MNKAGGGAAARAVKRECEFAGTLAREYKTSLAVRQDDLLELEAAVGRRIGEVGKRLAGEMPEEIEEEIIEVAEVEEEEVAEDKPTQWIKQKNQELLSLKQKIK